ncbi:penicillin-binding protein 2 [Granulicatella sp. zg-ZJ]|uniref:peptidoglycan D,D-transpeptidase FtsI family protein n=1 Tax=Granulicatella sp. zg-ZJ TaxID=2678504 RepID=UPI0013D7D98F|nr:penicillin-binding protein 2 [Granulicatella sp. zg-ZJ]
MNKKVKKSHIPLRLNLLFSVIVILFIILIVRLVSLQLTNHDKYTTILTDTKAIHVKTEMARGQIFDRNGVLLVGNKAHTTINYTRHTLNTSDMVKIATRLSDYISVSTEELKERDLKDYWAVLHKDELNSRLSTSEKKLSGVALYNTQLEKITAEDIMFSDKDKQIAAIFTRMNSISSLSTIAIKNREVTNEEIFNVTEHLTELTGISIGSDWERIYPEGDFLKAILGSVSTEKTGLPQQEANLLMAQGYASNSRVGTSFLEKQYDSVLRGTPKVTSVTLDTNNKVMSSTETYEGKAGSNLVLSLDTALQKRVDGILTNFLTRNIEHKGLNSSIYAVVQKTNTGEILSINGKKYAYNEEKDTYDTSKIEDDILGAMNKNFGMGSVVKAASVGIGYKYNVIDEENNVLIDSPLHFQNSNAIRSFFNQEGSVAINDITALERSSNVYMAKIALAVGGQPDFSTGNTLSIMDDTIYKLRREYAAYGLGGSTGIDLPNVSTGYSPYQTPLVGAVYLSFGQYDLYSPLQVSQYMTTVANDGVRFAPRLVREIRDINSLTGFGQVQTDMTPTLMNKVDLTTSQFSRIKEGLYRVVNGYLGTEYTNYAGFGISVAGKSGTAEAIYDGDIKDKAQSEVINSIFSGYAPSDNPDITVTVVVPHLEGNEGYAGQVARQIFATYFYN